MRARQNVDHERYERHERRRPRRQPRRGLVIGLGVLLPVVLVAGGGAVFAATAADTVDCALVVPANPLTAGGLATPYQLVSAGRGGKACRESNPDQAAFVQATVLDPDTGRLFVYNPLVVDGASRPAAEPVRPRLPARAVIGIWVGFNGDNLTLRGTGRSLEAGRCVDGLGRSIFGQFSFCNADGFFLAANQALAERKFTVPPLGTARDGEACPSTRAFSVVDQDQSDNVTATYLVSGRKIAQNTAANRAALRKPKVLANGSDNLLLTDFVDKALGCTPFTAPDLGDDGRPATSLALDELQAAAGQRGVTALVPTNDPMTLVGDNPSVNKTNLYRRGVDQPILAGGANTGKQYCANLVSIAQRRIQRDRNLTRRTTSPDPATGSNLFTFLAARLSGSFDDLDCGRLLRQRNPVRLTLKKGVAVDARFAQPVGAATG
jgi:hypothetical protein